MNTRKELKEYLAQDAKANRRSTAKCRLFDDDIWRFQVVLRKAEYYGDVRRKNPLFILPYIYYRLRLRSLSVKFGFTIPMYAIGKGLSIAHRGTIVIASNCRIGENFRVHESVNIGATNGSAAAPVIGDNVFVGTGAKIIGDITVADGVCIGANAVVVKSITEPDTTWAGVPARKISNQSSRANLSPMLFEG